MAGNIRDFTHLYFPPTDPTMPTLLMLHGTGGNEKSLPGLGRQLAPGAGLLSPRGKVLEGIYPRFFRRKAEGVFDIQDLIFRTHELADWLETAAGEYGITPESLIAVGYSNGANIAASMLLLRPDVLPRAVLMRAMVPLQPAQSPNLAGTEVLIEAGKFDSMINPAEGERLAQVLRGYGAQVTLQKQDADHGLIEADVSAAQDWLSRLAALKKSKTGTSTL